MKKSSAIEGHFVLCARPEINENNEVIKWFAAAVKISEIKTIHEKMNEYLPENNDSCIFYTCKDEWYICTMNFMELIKEINNFLSEGNSHGSEISGNYLGGKYLQKN